MTIHYVVAATRAEAHVWADNKHLADDQVRHITSPEDLDGLVEAELGTTVHLTALRHWEEGFSPEHREQLRQRLADLGRL